MVKEEKSRERVEGGLEMRGYGFVSMTLPSQRIDVEGIYELFSFNKKPAEWRRWAA